jgi:hypothetical protein
MGSFPFSLPGKKGLQPCWKRPDHDAKKGIKTRTRSQAIRGKTKIKCLPLLFICFCFSLATCSVRGYEARLPPTDGVAVVQIVARPTAPILSYSRHKQFIHLVDSNTDDSLPMTGIYLVQDGWPLTGTVPSYVYNST